MATVIMMSQRSRPKRPFGLGWLARNRRQPPPAIKARLDWRWLIFSSRRRHTRCLSDWSSDVCSSDLDGGDIDRASASRPDATPEDPRQHQCDRVGVLNCGAGLQERETLARWRPARAIRR